MFKIYTAICALIAHAHAQTATKSDHWAIIAVGS